MPTPIKIVLLGSGSSYPSPTRNHPGLCITYEGSTVMFDCGEAAQIRVQQAGISPLKIDSIYITHLHGDHFFGLPGMIYSMALQGRRSPLTVWGPSGIEALRSFIELSYHKLTFPVEFKQARPGIVVESQNWTVECIEVDHDIPALAYRFKEHDKHKVIKSKMRGLTQGEWIKHVMQGQTVVVQGKTVGPEILKTIPGRMIVYSGDTRPLPRLVEFAAGADLLIHESTYLETEAQMARDRFHSTALQAARTAKEAGAKKLVLYHYSRRYKDIAPMKEEAKTVFPKTIAGRDLQKFTL